MISPGEIYMADFADSGTHPAIVVSREELNRGDYVVAVPCTSSRFNSRRGLPNCVPFTAGQFGSLEAVRITRDCVAQCENILTLSKRDQSLAEGPIGILDDLALRDVIRAIGYSLASDCEPVM